MDFNMLDDMVCPCSKSSRLLQVTEGDEGIVLWKLVYTSVVLILMFAVLVTDRVGADSVMLAALTAFMAADVISVKEGLVGFSNEGVLSVMVLFVVAEGIARTGALDWYMIKLLGHPKSVASAQFRLMLPIVCISAFINNTPIVVVMIPIVQRWARNINISEQQLLIPLSFATILGGTCTLIGTSTNLVVIGLLQKSNPEINVGLFDLAVYGVPNALIGLACVLLVSPFVLKGNAKIQGQRDDDRELLLGARVKPWSPGVGRSIQRSGLRDTGGVYLVSVRRAVTGHLHRAVSGDFILNPGDILYFTSGDVESFGNFCREHGLELVTNFGAEAEDDKTDGNMSITGDENQEECKIEEGTYHDIGVTKESLLSADNDERLRCISCMVDMIHGIVPSLEEFVDASEPSKIIITKEQGLVAVGINTKDRPRLILDISDCFSRLEMTVHHAEAAVVGERSISVWRCDLLIETRDNEEFAENNVGRIWTAFKELLSLPMETKAQKTTGLPVLRAHVVKGSRLVGKSASEVHFRETYQSAIVAIEKSGKYHTNNLSSIRLQEGDSLILQATNDSALTKRPPVDFYSTTVHKLEKSKRSESRSSRPIGEVSELQMTTISKGNDTVQDLESATASSDNEAIWRDLQVNFRDDNDGPRAVVKEFLTAMRVSERSNLVGKSAEKIGIHRLPDLTLVSIERPSKNSRRLAVHPAKVIIDGPNIGAVKDYDTIESGEVENNAVDAVDHTEPLQDGDIIWFSGPVSAISDLRKIPGLILNENEQVRRLTEKIHDRRLIQAVISQGSPLLGKTVKESRFRTKYGAAVIAVHRDGKRVHEQPGRVKLQAGDVLLLEAGKSFLAKSGGNDRSFALLAEVEHSTPPQMALFVPAVLITLTMIAVNTANLTSLFIAGMIAVILMVLLGILSEQEARDAVKWDAYVTIAAAFGIGTAMVNSGVAGVVSDFLVKIGSSIGIGEAGTIGAVYLSTFLVSNIVTNNAAAALIFPIAIDAAAKTGTDPVLMSFTVMFGASASFACPFGYTTNLLVYGAGKYRFMDFVRIGTPLHVILWIGSVSFLTVIRPWYISWVVTAGVLTFVAAFRILSFSDTVTKDEVAVDVRTGEKEINKGKNTVSISPLAGCVWNEVMSKTIIPLVPIMPLNGRKV